MQLTTPGIPAIYYGIEQAFDGSVDYHNYDIESRRYAEDRYVRETMHGRAFGAFETEGCHFFNPNHPIENEVLMAPNTHSHESRGAEVTVEASLHPAGTRIKMDQKTDMSELKNTGYELFILLVSVLSIFNLVVFILPGINPLI